MKLAEASFGKTGIEPIRRFRKPVLRFKMLTAMKVRGNWYVVLGCAASSATPAVSQAVSRRKIQSVLGLGMLKDR
jgi:hypothetical protein